MYLSDGLPKLSECRYLTFTPSHSLNPNSSFTFCPQHPSSCPSSRNSKLKMLVFSVFTSPWTPPVLILSLVFYYLFPYFVTYHHFRKIPAPVAAKFSNLWLLVVARRGNRYATVHKIHERLGPVVRIQPNHVSLRDDEAIQVVYGHGNGFLKSCV